MHLFFDTETTGLPKSWSAPVTDADNWPRLVQLAWLLYDNEGHRLAGDSVIIKPEGFTIPETASKIHGITTERALAEGAPLLPVMRMFLTLLDGLGDFIVGHNIEFDKNIVAAELLRCKLWLPDNLGAGICTMKASTDLVKIKSHAGGNKWPKLTELHQHLFGIGFEGAHDAGADVRATARCFWELKRLGVIR